MRFVENQSKRILAGFGLGFNPWVCLRSSDEVPEALGKTGLPVIIKAQLPFGGREKIGAIERAEDTVEAKHAVERILAASYNGHSVNEVTLEAIRQFRVEWYLGVSWDLAAKLPVAIFGRTGGVDVEMAEGSQFIRRAFDPRDPLNPYQGRQMAEDAGLTGKALISVGVALARLAEAFVGCDANVLEVNPFVETSDGEFIGLDAHAEIEDDALSRQQQRLDPIGTGTSANAHRSLNPLEIEAERIDRMDYRGVAGRVVEFDGDLALLIGGGGASLTIFDAIQRHGGRPANYCEVGGNPTEEKVAALTALLLSKPGVRTMAVIMNVVNNTRADVMARGVLMGVKQLNKKPADVISLFRIPGSWEEEANQLMSDAGVRVMGRETSLDETARIAVKGAEPC